MRLFRTCSVTGRTFKRTGSNFAIGSKQRLRAEHVRGILNIMTDLSNYGPISSFAVGAMEARKLLFNNK